MNQGKLVRFSKAVVLALSLAAISCRHRQPDSTRCQAISLEELLQPFTPPTFALTTEDLREVTISAVFGNFGDTEYCAFLATPMPDGTYEVRLEDHEFDRQGTVFKVATCTIELAYADEIRKSLAKTPLSTSPAYPQVGNILFFLQKPDGRILSFGFPDYPAAETTPLNECVSLLRDAFMAAPIYGEDEGLKEMRSHIQQLTKWEFFTPRGDDPYLCVYDVSPICDNAEDVDKLARRIRESVSPGKWSADLGTSLEAGDTRLSVVAPPAMQEKVRGYLRQEGMTGQALEPIPPERLVPPRKFSEPKITILRTDLDDPMPEELLLIRPVKLTAMNARNLKGAVLFIAIENQGHLDMPTVLAVRSRQSPLLVTATLARLIAEAEEGEKEGRTARLKAIAERWKQSAPWSSRFFELFERFIRHADRDRL